MMAKKLSLTILLASIFCVSAFSSENDENKEGLPPSKKRRLDKSEEHCYPSSSQIVENAPVQPPAVKQTKREMINKYSLGYLMLMEGFTNLVLENQDEKDKEKLVQTGNDFIKTFKLREEPQTNVYRYIEERLKNEDAQEKEEAIENCNKISESLKRYSELRGTLSGAEIIDARIDYAAKLALVIQGYKKSKNSLFPIKLTLPPFLKFYESVSERFSHTLFKLEPSLCGSSSYIYNCFVHKPSETTPSNYIMALNYLLEREYPMLAFIFERVEYETIESINKKVNNSKTFSLLNNEIFRKLNAHQRFFGDKEVENTLSLSPEEFANLIPLKMMTRYLSYAEKLGQRNHDYSLTINILKTMCATYKGVLSLDYIEKSELDKLTDTIKITREKLPRPRIEDYTQQTLALQKYMDMLDGFFLKLNNLRTLPTPHFTDLTFIHQ